MTDNRLTPAALRGAVDLSSLARPATPRTTAGAVDDGTAAGASDAIVREVDDVSFADAARQSLEVPVIFALWSSSHPESRAHIDDLARIIRSYAGRLGLAIADIDVATQIRQALQVQEIPMVLGLLKGQPVPLYVGAQPEAAVRDVLDQVLEAAVANGVTGRIEGGAPEAAPAESADAQEAMNPLHQQAYDAIDSGDYDAAITAYESAIAQNADDEEARLGLGQVRLLQRTDGIDLNEARAAAADKPLDVRAQTTVADLDVLGGHVEDAFVRLIDLIKATAGDERNAAREHLISLFDVVGSSDPRVKKARTSLMSALY